MAWIVKDSANAVVERRDEPYLTPEMKREMEANLLPRYATKQAALLPVLHALQDKIGWLPGQALEEAGAFLGLTPAEVLDTATFYEEYFLKPKGEHLIQICRSISCELCGFKALREKLQAKLGILPGETTDDGKITLMEVECLGACDFAPCALVDHHLHETLSFEKLEKVIDTLK